MMAHALRNLQADMERLGWTSRDLWIAMFGLGSNLTTIDVGQIAERGLLPSAGEYDFIALAVNERLVDVGLGDPMRSWAQVQQGWTS
jgi:hypothetical protein